MAIVLNRTTGLTAPYQKDLRQSANTADFPTADWIINPDLSAVDGWESIYWDISGDNVLLVDAATRAARDTEIADNLQLSRRSDAVALPDDTESLSLRELFEVFNKRDNYLINRVTELQDTLIALQNGSGNAGARLDALPSSYLATNTRTRAQAIQDYKDDITAGGAD